MTSAHVSQGTRAWTVRGANASTGMLGGTVLAAKSMPTTTPSALDKANATERLANASATTGLPGTVAGTPPAPTTARGTELANSSPTCRPGRPPQPREGHIFSTASLSIATGRWRKGGTAKSREGASAIRTTPGTTARFECAQKGTIPSQNGSHGGTVEELLQW